MSTHYSLVSPETGTAYQLFAEIAPGPGAPLVLVLDGDDQFAHALEAYQTARDADLVPPLTMVGVGYGASYRSPNNKRVRDYTPTQPKDEPMQAGGADAFITFLEERLLPFLSEHITFPVESVGLGGHSLGSLLGFHALLKPRSLFSRFLLSAPSVWWDDRAALRSLDGPESGRGDFSPRRAFFCIGDEDTESMQGDFALLERRLSERPIDGIQTAFERLAGKDHYNAIPEAYATGLRWLYGS